MAKKEEKERTNEMNLFDGCFANFYFFYMYTRLSTQYVLHTTLLVLILYNVFFESGQSKLPSNSFNSKPANIPFFARFLAPVLIIAG